MLNISNCKSVIILEKAFYNTSFRGHFENIVDLRLHEKAFGSLKDTFIKIHKCNIDTLARLETSMMSINFSHTQIDTIASGAFDVVELDSIVFEYCNIRRIEMKALSNRVSNEYIHMDR